MAGDGVFDGGVVVFVTVVVAVAGGPVPGAGVEPVLVLPGDCVAAPPVQLLAMQTGTSPFTGTLPPVPEDPLVLCVAFWPVHVLATQMGTSPLTGAFAPVPDDPPAACVAF